MASLWTTAEMETDVINSVKRGDSVRLKDDLMFRAGQYVYVLGVCSEGVVVDVFGRDLPSILMYDWSEIDLPERLLNEGGTHE